MVDQGHVTSPFCCVRLLPRHSFGGCGCVLAKAVVAVAVIVVDAVFFFDFSCVGGGVGGG